MLKTRVRVLCILVGFILIFIFIGKLGNNDIDPLSANARKMRQQLLEEATPQQKREIVTEVLVGNQILSGTITEDGIRNGINVEGGMGFSFFDITEEGFEYNGYLEVTDWIVKDKRGEAYGVHWRVDPDIDSTEITYTIAGESPVTLIFDTEEMFSWKYPYADFTYSIRDLDENGNEVGDCSLEGEHINHRVLLDKTMYANTGVTCDPVPDEKLSGITEDDCANTSSIPKEDNTTNFGIRCPYKFEDDYLKIAVWDQWYIFEKIWEIDVTASEIREDGMTLVCSHTGSGIATNFHIKDNYSIEKKTAAGWEEVSPIAEIGWKGEEYFIPKNGSVETDVSWKDVYEEFTPGNYRVVKEVYWYDRTEDEYVTTTCFAAFEVR